MVSKVKSISLIALFMLVLATSIMARPAVTHAAACNNSAGYGTVTIGGNSLSLPSTGEYVIWSRINVPSTSNNSYQLEVNGNTCFRVGDSSSIPANQWTWVNYFGGTTSNKVQFNFSSTSGNTLKLIGIEPNVKIDRLILLGATETCVPTGMGDNCGTPVTNTSGNGGLAASAGNGTGTLPPPTTGPVSGTANTSNILANTDPTTIAKVEYYVEGRKIQESEGAQALDTTLLPNGTHKVLTKITYTDGTTTTEESTIEVNNSQNFISPVMRWVRINKRPLSIGGISIGAAVLTAGSFILLRHLYVQKRLLHFHGF